MRWIGVDEGQHELSHKPDSDKDAAGEADQDQPLVSASSSPTWRSAWPRPPSRAATAACSTTRSIVWTNELGKGNSHTLDNIPWVLVGNGLDFRMGRSLKYPKLPHNRLLLALAHGMGHRIDRFGNPDHCGEGILPDLT